MFQHLFKYRFKLLLKNKSILFWSLVFPIVLACFFKMAFSNLDEQFVVNTIPVGIVNNDQTDQSQLFQEAIKNAETNDKKLFTIKVYTEKEAQSALKANKISGYYELNQTEPALVVNSNGFNQTFLRSFLQQYLQITDSINYVAETTPQLLSEELVSQLTDSQNFTEKVTYSKSEPKSTTLYFLTVIAMACMFGMNWGVKNSDELQANQSPTGIRMTLNPLPKSRVVLANLLATFIIFFSEIMLILAFLHFVLKVDFGDRWLAIILTCLLACLLSISLGSLLGCAIVGNYNLKSTIVTTVSVFGGFLSGMMFPDVKYWVDQHLPLLGYLNPTNLITDALYKLFYYSDFQSFSMTIGAMLLMIIVINIGNFVIMRRQTYVSL